MVSNFNFHQYDSVSHNQKKVDPTKIKQESKVLDIVNILFGAFSGDVTAMRRYEQDNILTITLPKPKVGVLHRISKIAKCWTLSIFCLVSS